MREKFELIMKLFENFIKVMKPYDEVLGEGLAPLSDAWYDDIYRVGEFIGVNRDWCDA